MDCIKVIIANHQSFVCSGIRTVLSNEPDLLVIGEARTKQEAKSACLELEPKILLLDSVLIENDQYNLIHFLKAEIPDIEILVLFERDPDEDLPGYFASGVRGCLLKDEEAQPLVRAVHAVASGDTWFSFRIIDCLLNKSDTNNQKQRPSSPLTIREREIMNCLASGMSNQEIAQDLRITERTVRHHVEQIMIKLNVPNRTKAVIVALKNDWIKI